MLDPQKLAVRFNKFRTAVNKEVRDKHFTNKALARFENNGNCLPVSCQKTLEALRVMGYQIIEPKE